MALGFTGAGDITGGTFNRPVVRAHLNAHQGVGDNVTTVIQFNSVTIDTNSCYSTSTYKFTPDVSGYYFVHAKAHMGQDGGTSDVHHTLLEIVKNSSNIIAQSRQNPANDAEDGGASHSCSTIIDMNGTSDYLQFMGKVDTGSTQTEIFYGNGSEVTQFCAFRLHA